MCVLDNLLEAVDHDLLGLLQRRRELDPVLDDEAHAHHRVGQEHHVVILSFYSVSVLKRIYDFNRKFIKLY